MELDGIFRDEKLLRDLPVRLSVQDQLQQVALSRREVMLHGEAQKPLSLAHLLLCLRDIQRLVQPEKDSNGGRKQDGSAYTLRVDLIKN